MKRNLTDLIGGDVDEQTARDILAENESLRRAVAEQTDQSLTRQVLAYERRILEYRTVLEEMGLSRQSLGEDFPCMLLPATVIGSDPTGFADSRLIRPKGRSGPGQYVTTRELLTNRPTAIPEQVAALSGASVVGRITSSGAWTAHLQLLTDRDFRLRAYVVRLVYDGCERPILIEEPDPESGLTVLRQRPLTVYDPVVPVNLAGTGVDMVSAEVPAHHAIEPGDLVVTMGDDGWLPMQVTIGFVDRVETLPDSPKHVQLHVAVAVDLASLRRVSVVIPLARRER